MEDHTFSPFNPGEGEMQGTKVDVVVAEQRRTVNKTSGSIRAKVAYV